MLRPTAFSSVNASTADDSIVINGSGVLNYSAAGADGPSFADGNFTFAARDSGFSIDGIDVAFSDQLPTNPSTYDFTFSFDYGDDNGNLTMLALESGNGTAPGRITVTPGTSSNCPLPYPPPYHPPPHPPHPPSPSAPCLLIRTTPSSGTNVYTWAGGIYVMYTGPPAETVYLDPANGSLVLDLSDLGAANPASDFKITFHAPDVAPRNFQGANEFTATAFSSVNASTADGSVMMAGSGVFDYNEPDGQFFEIGTGTFTFAAAHSGIVVGDAPTMTTTTYDFTFSFEYDGVDVGPTLLSGNGIAPGSITVTPGTSSSCSLPHPPPPPLPPTWWDTFLLFLLHVPDPMVRVILCQTRGEFLQWL